MLKKAIFYILAILISVIPVSVVGQAQESKDLGALPGVYVIPIEGQINQAQFYILRRGLKQALDNGVNTVVLKIDTEGGALDVTLEMMEALSNFTGKTISFVDKKALSAGAYIASATDEIYFAPDGIIGAAAVIQATGQNVDASLKKKIDSYLRAKVRSLTEGHRYRSDVIRAMMDEDFVFTIGSKTLKSKGELLSLTAKEALVKYGSPQEPLLGAGINETVKELLDSRLGVNKYRLTSFELTWSEDLAKWMNTITPLLLGAGLLFLFIEFKTPGFGFFGVTGIVLVLLVFASSYVAGLAGYEEVLFFLLGVILLLLEVLFFPGIMIFGVAGMVLILGSIVWALADIWPTKEFQLTGSVFLIPLVNVALGLILAIGGIIVLGRYVFKSWVWDRLVLHSAVLGRGQEERGEQGDKKDTLIGRHGITVTELVPTGIVEVDGKRYEARSGMGLIEVKINIEVIGKDGFSLIVRPLKK